MKYTFTYSSIPEYMRGGIIRYVNSGIRPGGFLTAIIENDLIGACSAADDINLPLIPVYVAWFYNRAPSGCSGSPDVVSEWSEGRGMVGINKNSIECDFND